MPIQLKGVTQVALPVGDDNIFAIRVIISGAFSSAAEYRNLIRDVFYSDMVAGAVISVPQRRNLFYAPDDTDKGALDPYTIGNNTVLGNNDGFHFTYARETQTINGVNYVNGVYCRNSYLYYKTIPFYYCQTGGFAGYTEQVSAMPIIIITDSDYNLYQIRRNSPTVPIAMSYNAGWNMNSAIYPTIAWYRSLYIGDMFDSYFPDSMALSNLPILSTENIKDDITNEIPIGGGDDEDPFEDGGYAGEDDGDTGDFDYDGDPQPGNSPAAFHTGLDTGFYTLYAPSSAELQNLATYLWSTNFDLNLFKRLFNNPMDLFLVLGILPVTIPKGSQKEVGIGLITTGVYMTTAADRVVTKDMGTIHVSGTTASYLDYAPYTHVDLLLPFVGVVPIEIDAIMGKDVNVLYNVDVLTGSCVALVNAGKSGAMHCIGAYAGNCMRSIPLTGADYTTMLSGLVQTAGAIAAGAATGGAAGAVAGGLSAASSAVVNEGKPMIQKGGAISSSAGFMLGSNQMRPLLIFSLPKQCLPSLQMVEMGFPAYTSDKWEGGIRSLKILSDYKNGNKPTFVKIAEINLKSIHLTSTEIEELESILKEGIFV
mgnify:CR=1 FL=1